MKQEPERKFYLREFKAISRAISTYEDFNLLINHIVEGTSRTFEAQGCSLLLLDEREMQWFPVASYGLSDEYLQTGPILMDERYCAFATGKPVFVENLQNDERIQYPKAAAKEGIITMLSVPVKSHEEVIGLIRIYHGTPREFHHEDVDTLCVLAEQLGLVIENNGLKNFLEGVKIAMESLPLRMLEGF
jgi:signal transduction protein with GAF and PtsI domain